MTPITVGLMDDFIYLMTGFPLELFNYDGAHVENVVEAGTEVGKSIIERGFPRQGLDDGSVNGDQFLKKALLMSQVGLQSSLFRRSSCHQAGEIAAAQYVERGHDSFRGSLIH